ncbi:protein OXIDATIVE STRESS 3 LIKE 1 isoform X3 [Ziziphus jujuba]|uniref:Protein OXIDATIVE STRESS 3 LIKE 1 isoform X3 n=1 Tax=Ziziphus jujuba TaxID=326968 RepID=A0ABM4AED6_ZIZJJ|nr:protein OXIDATIVE STRESS 3 LIKE 1 isoform X3 [Ziziphus jujuba]
MMRCRARIKDPWAPWMLWRKFCPSTSLESLLQEKRTTRSLVDEENSRVRICSQLSMLLIYKRGISKFYGGKSKSFTSLADASSVSSIKDLAKPENPYNKKRKNLLARTNPLEKSRNCPLKNNGGGILKKLANSNRNSNLLGDTLSSSGCNNNHDDSNLFSTSPSSCLPPLHPHIKRSPGNGSSSPPQRQSPWRSFSLSDLQCVAASTPNITGLAIYSGDEDNKSH